MLVAAAKFGGYVIGTDIDFLMLHGRTRPTRKQTRVKHFKLNNYKRIELIINKFSFNIAIIKSDIF